MIEINGKIELTLAELSEILSWADNMYTTNLISVFGGELADKFWELYKEEKAKNN